MPLGKGWSLNLNVSEKESVLIILGPQGQGAAWTCEAGLVRHNVLNQLFESQAPILETKEPHIHNFQPVMRSSLHQPGMFAEQACECGVELCFPDRMLK